MRVEEEKLLDLKSDNHCNVNTLSARTKQFSARCIKCMPVYACMLGVLQVCFDCNGSM